MNAIWETHLIAIVLGRITVLLYGGACNAVWINALCMGRGYDRIHSSTMQHSPQHLV